MQEEIKKTNEVETEREETLDDEEIDELFESSHDSEGQEVAD